MSPIDIPPFTALACSFHSMSVASPLPSEMCSLTDLFFEPGYSCSGNILSTRAENENGSAIFLASESSTFLSRSMPFSLHKSATAALRESRPPNSAIFASILPSHSAPSLPRSFSSGVSLVLPPSFFPQRLKCVDKQ
ncbi:Uncharacterised protein [uncultured archaeon]|nr:Uncharacterised protein [uncultured archaeon]